nr:hypothetical protein [Streptomyces poonensis]
MTAAALFAGCAGPTHTGGGTGAAPADRRSGPAGAGATISPGAPQVSLLVTDFAADTVTFVDPGRGPTGSVVVGTAPYGLAVGKDGRAWVATADAVAVVDTHTRRLTARVPYATPEDRLGPVTHGEYRGGGMGIALSPDGRHVHVGVNVPGGPGVLETIDTRTRKVIRTAPVGRRPMDVDVSRDGREVYATGHDSFDVTVVPTDGGRPRRVEVAPYGTEGGLGSWLKPHHTVVRPSDGRLLLPFEGERLAVADPRSGRVTTERMTANTHQHGAEAGADGTLFVVGTGAVDPASDAGPSLTVRRRNGDEQVIPLQGAHEDVAVSRDGRTAYVTGGFTRDGHWNGLTVVDVATGTTRRLSAGRRPLDVAVLGPHGSGGAAGSG